MLGMLAAIQFRVLPCSVYRPRD